MTSPRCRLAQIILSGQRTVKTADVKCARNYWPLLAKRASLKRHGLGRYAFFYVTAASQAWAMSQKEYRLANGGAAAGIHV